MKRVMLTVAYDGTAYHGWQIQPNGETIEGILNRCLSETLGEKIEVIGASRTDSGVHAMGNIAVFDTDSPIPADKMSYALNQRLPEDIKIQKSEEVAADFHPRHCESRKTYEYRIYCASFPMPVRGSMPILPIFLWMCNGCVGERHTWWVNMILRAFAVQKHR